MRRVLSKLSCAIALVGFTGLASSAHATLFYESLGDTSAYVYDWAIGSTYTNYAFSALNDAYVGQWQVDQGPSWNTVPIAYSGVLAAALLFGGTAADYVISTVDSNPANINGLAWVSTWGGACGGDYPCGTQVADTFVQGTEQAPAPVPGCGLLSLAFFAVLGLRTRTRTFLRSASGWLWAPTART